MAKKKREHIVFDQMLKIKKSIPFGKVNRKEEKSIANRYNKATKNNKDVRKVENSFGMK